MSEGSSLDAIVPILSVAHLGDAIAHYRDVLGFEVVWTWGEPPHLAGICRDAVELNLGERGKGGPPSTSQVYFRVRGVDSIYRQLEERGAQIRVALDDRPYGMRDFSVRDPSGNVLDFGEACAAAGDTSGCGKEQP